jgi:hypothetical protein
MIVTSDGREPDALTTLYDVEERGRRLDPVLQLALRRRVSMPLTQRIEPFCKTMRPWPCFPKAN